MKVKLPVDAEIIIHRFIKDVVTDAKAMGVVVGLSGGLDSAVVIKLASDALGPEAVLAMLMPQKEGGDDTTDSIDLCESLGVEYHVVTIGELTSSVKDALGDLSEPVAGNVMARLRMVLLYAVANAENRIVLGTTNKSELLVGYFTKWGDGGSDCAPIGDLYKTQVRELAGEIGIPERFITKPPSAGLCPGQTDEEELGCRYDSLDRVLKGIELRMNDEDVASESGVPIDEVVRIRNMIKWTIHKRRLPLVLKLSARTVGADWRE